MTQTTYQGKTLQEWIAALDDRDSESRSKAAKAVAQFGEDAVPSLKTALAHKSEWVRCGAAEAIGQIGPKAEAAVPALAAALRDEVALVRAVAASNLIGMGSKGRPAIAALKETLQDKDVVVRLRAAQALVAIDAGSDDSSIPVLVDSLKQDIEFVRSDAAIILGDMRARAKAAVSALNAALKDPSPGVRNTAETALKKIGGQ